MAKRRGLGNPWQEGKPHTGAAAVAAVTGAPPPAKGRRQSAPVASEAPAAVEGWTVTTLRLTRRQASALRRAALDRSEAKGHGKPDASAIVRELVDEWIAGGGK